MKVKMVIQFFGIALISMLLAMPATAQDARAIMDKVDAVDDGTTQVSRQKLKTCRYTKKGKKIVCAEKPRIKVMESIRKDFGANQKDIKAVTIVLEPSSERGIGFLQYDYEEPGKDADQWMYLSALGKVKRIVSGNDDEPRTGSFFGTEFGYEDLEDRDLDDYTYKVLKSEKYRKRDTWVIETKPTPARARKSNYSKTISWIDKERYLVLKVIMFDRQGKRIKRLTFGKIEQIDGIWTSRRLLLNNLQTKRMTTFNMENIAYNVDVEDEFLTQRTLTDGAFRENKLGNYRSHLK